jgi:Tfp pilus assembly protein PilX
MKYSSSFICNKKGSVLIIALLILTLISILGVASMLTSRTDISISGNIRVLKEAFYSAEVGLTEGEQFIDNMANEFLVNENNIGHYNQNKQILSDMKWDSSDSIRLDPDNLMESVGKMADPPRYTIEKRRTVRDSERLGGVSTGTQHYNVTSQGTGSSRHTKAIVQSIFAVRFN